MEHPEAICRKEEIYFLDLFPEVSVAEGEDFFQASISKVTL